MKNFNILKTISKHRTQLMGLAILWVMLRHSHIQTDCSIIRFISQVGLGGVDMFIFLSGFGLYFASLKKQNTIQFYKKRIIRIIPAFWISLLFVDYFLLQNISLKALIAAFSTLDYWIYGIAYKWYIAVIMLFYLFFPFFMKLFNKKKYLTVILSVIFGIIASLSITYNTPPQEWNTKILFTTRIPLFSIGVLTGWLANKEQINNKTLMIPLFFFLTIGISWLYIAYLNNDDVALARKGLYYYPFILITPGLCLIISQLLSLIKTIRFEPLTWLGTYSLEIYLIHTSLFTRIDYMADYLCVNRNTSLLLISVFSLFCAFILKRVANVVVASLYKSV